MKTKRNIKSKPDTSPILLDFAVVLLSLATAFAALFLFIKNLTVTLERNEKSIGTVTFKKKTVQRKFLDRAVWDRPVQHSPVYNGDTIRTAGAAEAKVFLSDNNVIDIGSDTMIQIFVKDNEEAEIGLKEGAVSVQTSNTKIKINSNNASVVVKENSLLHADKADTENLRLVVETGEAAVSEQTADENIAAGQNTKTLQKDSVFQSGTEAAITMISPSQNVKILNQNTERSSVNVLFKWQTSLPENEELILETASVSDFSQNNRKFSVTGLNEISIEQPDGNVYWKLYPKKQIGRQALSAQGKFTVLPAPVPLLLIPAKESKYFYKNTPPSVRFLWKGNESAASYLLEIADNPDMVNPKFTKSVNMESLAVSALNDGIWYWRVTPYYLTAKETDVLSSEVFSFKIEKRSTLPEPEALFPKTVADTASSKSLTFSWKTVEEAKKYRMIISDNENMSNPIIDTVTADNYLELKEAAKLLPNGTYYWTVLGTDEKGAVLTESKPRSFKTLDTEVTLRSVFPPDGYIIADTLCRDTRFTWKTNLTSEQHFQVSDTEDFSNIVKDIKTFNTGVDGIELKTGTWYWRVISSAENFPIKTETKKVIIAPPFEKPQLVNIGADKRIIILQNRLNKFKWTEVKGADYYQIKIKKPGLEKDVLYENLFITETEIELDFKDIADGPYIVSIQGFASATLSSSRRYGLAEDSEIFLRHLKPVELLSPVDNARINGVEAMLNPGKLIWASSEKPENANLLVTKTGSKEPVLSLNNPGFTVKLPPLEAGKYTWRVTASTIEGLDISSEKNFEFTVLPIPPLQAVKFISPKENAVLNAAFFKENRTIDFSWNAIEEATVYLVEIYTSNKKSKPVYSSKIGADGKKEILLKFRELALLSRGSFYIEVRAQRHLKDGKLFQDGIVSMLKFEINLPKRNNVETNETGVLYGK
ncbi:FecR domain-containing protein [Treponema pedis]|uniref:FecR domain-containing protein n=1 Tax=Treponema pedis TaxID=409322 RepID=UPI00041EB229|nr:FecR domain-containing protein [Treponema pedis]